MAEVKIKPGSLTIEVWDGKVQVAMFDFPMLTLDKVTVEPKRSGIEPAGEIWPHAPAMVGKE